MTSKGFTTRASRAVALAHALGRVAVTAEQSAVIAAEKSDASWIVALNARRAAKGLPPVVQPKGGR